MNTTIFESLTALLSLQAIDNKIYEIKRMQGALPSEIQYDKNEISILEDKLKEAKNYIKELKQIQISYRVLIKEAENHIVKYETQQMEVKNDREYDAISKEIELKKLEIELLGKKIKDNSIIIDEKKQEVKETTTLLKEKQDLLEKKHGTLEQVIENTNEETSDLEQERIQVLEKVEKKLLQLYNRLRKNFKNGLVVTTVNREACNGCFNIVIAQKQVEIKSQKKIVICEHCGRILADIEEEILEEIQADKSRKKALPKKD